MERGHLHSKKTTRQQHKLRVSISLCRTRLLSISSRNFNQIQIICMYVCMYTLVVVSYFFVLYVFSWLVLISSIITRKSANIQRDKVLKRGFWLEYKDVHFHLSHFLFFLTLWGFNVILSTIHMNTYTYVYQYCVG